MVGMGDSTAPACGLGPHSHQSRTMLVILSTHRPDCFIKPVVRGASNHVHNTSNLSVCVYSVSRRVIPDLGEKPWIGFGIPAGNSRPWRKTLDWRFGLVPQTKRVAIASVIVFKQVFEQNSSQLDWLKVTMQRPMG